MNENPAERNGILLVRANFECRRSKFAPTKYATFASVQVIIAASPCIQLRPTIRLKPPTSCPNLCLRQTPWKDSSQPLLFQERTNYFHPGPTGFDRRNMRTYFTKSSYWASYVLSYGPQINEFVAPSSDGRPINLTRPSPPSRPFWCS